MVAVMARYLIELELEIEDSRRSPADTRARALKVGRSIAGWAARLRHARVIWAQLEAPHGRIHKIIEEEPLELEEAPADGPEAMPDWTGR